MAARNHGGIAGLFGQRRQPMLQPPRHRVEPEDTAIERGEPLRQWIAAADVLAFVSQYGVEFGPRPGAPLGRQDHGRPKPSYSDRAGAFAAGEESVFRSRAAAQPRGARRAKQEADEEERRHRHVHGEHRIGLPAIGCCRQGCGHRGPRYSIDEHGRRHIIVGRYSDGG
jgi:hypothetical protein